MYLFYSFLLALLLLLTLPWWVAQMLRLGKYRAGLLERLGRVPRRIRQSPEAEVRPVAWIHAVSVGEVLAIAPLASELRQRGYRVVVSTTTHTGQRLARERFGAENAFYFPLDLGLCIRPYLRWLRPRLVVLAETEFWPNFLRLARASGAHLAVVNARISDRSLPRYRRWRPLLRRVLEPAELFLAQSGEDAERLRAIGARAERVKVCGNLKFDVAPPKESEAVAHLGRSLRAAGGPIVVAGSTVEEEEPLLLRAFAAVVAEHPTAVLVLAPRHRERFDEVAALMAASGVPWLRRSQLAAEAAPPAAAANGEGTSGLAGHAVLLDSLGELAAVYRYADVAFVGGSLAARGGHNILEPAFFARAILTGPHTENFRDILACFERGRAVLRVSAPELEPVFLRLLREPPEREELGRRAHQVLCAERGATARTVAELAALDGHRQTQPDGPPEPQPQEPRA